MEVQEHLLAALTSTHVRQVQAGDKGLLLFTVNNLDWSGYVHQFAQKALRIVGRFWSGEDEGTELHFTVKLYSKI